MDRNSRILVVDDQEDLRAQVARMLQQRAADQETSSLIMQIRHRIGRGTRETQPAPAVRATYDVETYAQGKEAFEAVKQSLADNNPFALMFLDMRMPPGWDGLETAQRIRSVDKEIQIVIMTAYADYDQNEIAEKLGEPDKLIYLKKPFHPEEIRQLALALTEKWNLNRREKERQVLTNRLMRENGFLTRQPFDGLDFTLKGLVDAFVSFLDASQGMFVQREGGTCDVRVATAPELAGELLDRLPQDQRNSARVLTSDTGGYCLLPLLFPELDGFVYVVDKKLQYSYDQLRTYLDILLETGRGVVRTALQLDQDTGQDSLAQIAPLMAALNQALSGPETALGIASNALPDPMGKQAARARETLRRIEAQLALLAKAGARALDIQPQMLSPLVEAALGPLKSELTAAGVTVSSELAADLDAQVDAGVLGDALSVVLARARIDLLDHPAGTGKSLTITARLTDDEPQRVALTCQWTQPPESPDEPPVLCLCQSMVEQVLHRLGGHCLEPEAAPGEMILVLDLPATNL